MPAAVIVLLLFAQSGQASSLPLSFVNEQCGYSLRYPDGWRIRALKSEKSRCAVAISPLDLDERMKKDPELDIDVWTVTVDRGEGDFDAAAESAGFERATEDDAPRGGWPKPGEWIIRGRGGWATGTDPINVGSLRGLRGEAQTGCYSRSDGYIGAGCPSSVAFLTDGERWVSIHANPEAPFDAILGTIRILPPRASPN